MTRWLAFDENTAALLHEELPEQQIFEHGAQSALEYALGARETTVTVFPVNAEGESGIAVVRRPKAQIAEKKSEPRRTAPEPPKPAEKKTPESSTRPGGFLGLRDEPVFEEEEPPKKKNWWQRFWDE